MDVTIKDLMNFQNFDGIALIAGGDGLHRVVTKCGVLDYEFDIDVKKKYLHSNFEEGQFVLTSLLFAKDNEHLILEALKHLINRNVSGLIIKNVFGVPLSERLLHYANSKKFPIFLIKNPTLYFEDIIFSITDCIRTLSTFHFGEKEADIILNASIDNHTIVQQALQINYSFRTNHFAIYIRSKENNALELYKEMVNRFKNSSIYTPSDALFSYRDGLMLIHSCEIFHSEKIEELASDYIYAITDCPEEFYIGISDLHYSLPEIKKALEECMQAAVINQNELYTFYKDLGVYQIIIPFVHHPQLQNFSNKIVVQLVNYDAENKTKLTETAIQLVQCGGNIKKLAKAMQQHENTIRYRLDKIRNIIDLDTRNPEQYEQFSIAIKIYIARNKENSFYYKKETE